MALYDKNGRLHDTNKNQLNVAQLIELLSKMPPDKPVLLRCMNDFMPAISVWQEKWGNVVIGEKWFDEKITL